MKRLGLVLAFCVALVGSAFAQGGMGPGPGTVHSTGSTFQGPGDIVSGAYAWYSCSRGYNAADVSNACNVCLPSAGACFDLTLSAGFAVVPAGLLTCNITTVICTIKTAYDKSGNGRDITQATEANRPTFRPAMASNGCPTTALPCMLFIRASSQKLVGSGGVAQAQPITVSLVFINTNVSSGSEMLDNFPVVSLYNPGTTQVQILAGSTAAATASNSTWHATQGVFNSSSSAIYTDGVATTGLNAGTSAGVNAITLGAAAIANTLDGSIAEAGFWPSGFNATQAGNMNTNQHGSNGYNF